MARQSIKIIKKTLLTINDKDPVTKTKQKCFSISLPVTTGGCFSVKQNLHKGLPEVLVEHSVDYLKREFGDIMGIMGFVLNPMHHIFYQYLTF